MGADGCLCMARTDGRMAVCPVDPMNDAPMISALHKDCALPWRCGAVICHLPSEQPRNRTTEHQIVAANLDIAWRYSDGRMAVCPVGPMNDDPMISAMPKDSALPLAGAGLSSEHFPSEHPGNRTTEHPTGGPKGVFVWRKPMVGWRYARLIQ